MAIEDNRPQITEVLGRLAALPPSLLERFAQVTGGNTSYPLLEDLLAKSISWVEDEATTAFNSTAFYNNERLELYDGNTTNQIVVRNRPVLSVQKLQVVTPILGYTRVYTEEEIKDYVKQGIVKVFTYKLAVEQALLQTIDYQAWGSLFPPLPQAVQIAYTYGYPLYDPASTAVSPHGPATSFDGGITWEVGDQREPKLNNWLANLKEAAVCNACAQFLGQAAGLARGVVSSVSFDGYARGFSGNPFQAEVEALLARRDELMQRRKRRFAMATIG
jgi:hypothetical protein